LSNSSISRDFIPLEWQRKFPKSYKTIPTTLLGRLAVDVTFHGKGLGRELLVEALYRSYLASKEIGSVAVVVDPIDDNAQQFYVSYGFQKLPDSGKLFLAMKTIAQLFVS
jgi:GNAT superfamily N-acetyltransferase